MPVLQYVLFPSFQSTAIDNVSFIRVGRVLIAVRCAQKTTLAFSVYKFASVSTGSVAISSTMFDKPNNFAE